MFIETSKDLLFVVLAFCVLWLTVFLSWLLYYLIAMFRDAEALTRQARAVVEKVDGLAHALHDKMERSAATFSLIASTIKDLVVWGIQEKTKTSKRPTGKKHDDDEE